PGAHGAPRAGQRGGARLPLRRGARAARAGAAQGGFPGAASERVGAAVRPAVRGRRPERPGGDRPAPWALLAAVCAGRAGPARAADRRRAVGGRSLDLLAFVAPRVGELPLALIVATRPDEGMTAVLGRGAERIQPAPLSASAVGELVGEQLGPP